MTDDKPKYCNECGRDLKQPKDIERINIGSSEHFYYGCCQYCRAASTRRANRWKNKEKRTLEVSP